MPYNDEHKLFFIHIPKSAGTAIGNNKDLFFRGGGHFNILKDHHFKTRKDYSVFTVIRNPWDRFVSAYKYVIMEKSFHHDSRNHTKHPLHDLFKDKTLKECAFFMLNNRNLNTGNHNTNHFHTQSFYLDGYDGKIDLLSFDNLPFEYTNFIKKKTGLDINLEKINITTTKTKPYWDYYEDKETVDMVYEIYKDDFKLYNFKFKKRIVFQNVKKEWV